MTKRDTERKYFRSPLKRGQKEKKQQRKKLAQEEPKAL